MEDWDEEHTGFDSNCEESFDSDTLLAGKLTQI